MYYLLNNEHTLTFIMSLSRVSSSPSLLVSDIKSFIDINSRSLNSKNNNVRENIIARIFNCPSSFFTDSEYGIYWSTIRDKLEDALYSCFPSTCSPYTFSILQKGGMNCNHDFEISTQHLEIKNILIEFKHNATTVKKLPQILELYDRDLCGNKYRMTSYSYSEFYYDNYLSRYLNFDKMSDNIIEVPEKDVYLKHISDTKYRHPFFHYLYVNRDSHKVLKHRLVEQSKKEYLETYSSTFRFEGIEEKLRQSQGEKVYLMWDKTNFRIEQSEMSNIRITGIKDKSLTHSCFDIDVENASYNLRVRLNWGNNNGIANPRWKIGYVCK